MKKLIYTIAILIASFTLINGQTADRERFIQVTGILTDDQNKPVQNGAVISLKLRRGSISEKTGIFSITSTPGDTLQFRALGFKLTHSVIPPSFEGRLFNLDVILEPDTILIEDVVILPWKNYSEFIKEMSEIRPVEPEIANMNENLASVYASASNETGIRITPEAGYRYAMEQNFNAVATRNQSPYNNLMNPFAWAKFFSEVKNGLFKNKVYNKPVRTRPKANKK